MARTTKKPDFDFAIFSKFAELTDNDLAKKLEHEKDRFFGYSSNTITIYDLFPKAIFHLLILPRVKAPPRTTGNLHSLRNLFSKNVPKEVARQVIQEIADEAYTVKAEVEEEMLKCYRFKWPVHMGFHAVQSMDHIHLHIISDDFSNKCLKKKRHYNSFNPTADYFVHLDDVLSWFEAVPEFYDLKIKPIKYQQHRLKEILSGPLECHHCNVNFDNKFAEFKRHLDAEWMDLEKTEQAKADAREKFLEQQAIRKAKREAAQAATGDGGSLEEAGTAEAPFEVDE